MFGRSRRQSRTRDSESSPGILTCEHSGPVTYLHVLFDEGFQAAESSRAMDALWEALEAVVARRQKVLVIDTARDLFSRRNLDTFLERVKGYPQQPCSSGFGWFPEFPQAMALQQRENAFMRFIKTMREMDTFVVCVLQGEITLPFLGPSLACDYRIASADTVFFNRCLQKGFPVCGALPWFLVRHVGRGKALQLLMNQGPMPVGEAADLGLVDLVVETQTIDQEVRSCAEDLSRLPGPGLMVMKRLLASVGGDLGTYLAEETKAFEKWLHWEA